MNIRRFSISTRIVVILMLIGTGVFVAIHANTPASESKSSDTEKNWNIISWLTPQTAPTYMFLIALAIFLFKYPSKDDVKSMKDDLQGNIKSLKDDLEGDIKSMEDDLQGNIKSLKDDLEGDIESLKTDIENDIKNNREELQRVRKADTDHLNFHLYTKQDSPNQQKGESLDEHINNTRPSSAQED